CTGTIGGTTTATIFANNDNATIAGATYSAAESGVILTVTRTSGDLLTFVDSAALTFNAQVAGIVVTTPADTGAGSLREAITRSNNGECTLPCAITFNITPPGPQTIALGTALPSITLPVNIDATTQPGWTSDPIVDLDGSVAGIGANGFDIDAGSSTIKGFIIRSFGGSGIRLDTGGGNTIQGNWIGLNVTGTGANGNQDGIRIVVSDNNTIGGNVAASRNVIGGNASSGIFIGSSANNNTVAGNYIGTNATGTVAVPNANGITLDDTASTNTIGGASSADGNLISGNSAYGIYMKGGGLFGARPGQPVANPVLGSLVQYNIVTNNTIGVAADGTTALGNSTAGVKLDGYCDSNEIGQAGAGNTISGNGYGVVVNGGSSIANKIVGNRIGVSADALTAISNTTSGITIVGGANTMIGGLATSDANVIAHNSGLGVEIISGGGNQILGNDFHDNGDQAIDLGSDGPDTNDDVNGDIDTGANGKQNYPVITKAELAGGNIYTEVSLSSASAPTTVNSIRLQFYLADDGTSGEGTTLLLNGPCVTGNVLANYAVTVPAGTGTIGDPLVATATSYNDAGCGLIADGTSEFSPVFAIAACTPPTATITPSGATTFCTGGSVTLTASAGSSYSWSTGDTTASIVVNASGSYSVTVFDAAGCSATSAPTTVTVNPNPSVTISGPTTSCDSATLTVPAGFASYAWSNGGNGNSITVTTGGTYSVDVTDANGCTATDNHTVTIKPNPTVTISGPTTACDSATLTVPAGFANYAWSNGGTGNSITVNTSGTYSVTVTDANGCTATDTHAVTINPNPTVTITGPATACDSATLTAPAGFANYAWSNGGTGNSITV
ncbi:MAG: beta strand repeat-containing protein, partial [Thermoanaerobaculia bacterium]